MVPRLRVAAFALTWITAGSLAFAELDLTPEIREESIEGSVHTVAVFKAGDAEIRYDPPIGWETHGSRSVLKLRPPGSPDALATISTHPKPADATWSDVAVSKLSEALLATIYEDAREGATVAEPVVDGMRINGHPTVLVAIDYTSVGERMRKSWLVCNFANEQVRFEFVAKASDYPALYEPFRVSIFSWNGLE